MGLIYKAGSWVQLGIALADGDALIGDIGLWLGEDCQTAQIGYSCALQYQRQGLTAEAVSLLLSALAQHTPCKKIRASLDSRNVASERLLRRLSFRHVESSKVVFDGAEITETTYELDLDRRCIEDGNASAH